MKKLLTILLTLILSVACLTGCKINKDGEVAVLWADKADSLVVELADSMDRSMYLNNIDYSHYYAENDSANQLNQVNQVLQAGCSALIVNLVDDTNASNVVALAKDKNVPVVFIESNVDGAVLDSYDKAYLVNSQSNYDSEYASMVKAYLEKNFDKLDSKNGSAGDGKLVVYADSELSSIVDSIDADYNVERASAIAYDGSVELILTKNGEIAVQTLLELRKNGYNKDKLETMLVGVFTVGVDKNAGAVIDDGKNRTGDEKEKYEAKLKHYSVMNAIDDGFVQGAVIINDDGVTLQACDILTKYFKGKEMPSENGFSIKYTVYTK